MLQQLSIKNYAIIQEAKIVFDNRLNIITGETGAGKSILMGALGLILGERADTKVLRDEKEKCVVEGLFKIKSYKLRTFFEEQELDYDDECLIRREISTAGKSRAFVNDTPVSLTQLKDLGSRLVEIVSQHETLELNDKAFQLELIDILAAHNDLLQEYKAVYSNYRRTAKELEAAREEEAKARQEEDYLRFVLNELTEAQLQTDEQTTLEQQLNALTHAETIQQSSYDAANVLDNGERSLTELIRSVRTLLGNAAKHHPGIAALIQRLDSTGLELKDIAAELEQISQSAQADPAELQRMEERLDLMNTLQKKHRVNDNVALLQLQSEFETRLQNIQGLEDEIQQLAGQLEKLQEALNRLADALSASRKQAIPVFQKNIQTLLRQVEMPDAMLEVNQQPLEDFTASGKDEIELMFSANKGSKPQPLHKVASGGELSRLMLCIKSLMSDQVALPTIVFDEIDTGISGEAALKVAQVMKKHAIRHQVLAITHLPQIAGKADAHFFVSKSSDKISTQTHINRLSEAERLSEIARMLHGANPDEKVIEAARVLIG